MRKPEQTYLDKPLERIDIESFNPSPQNVFCTDTKKDLQIKNWLINEINNLKSNDSAKFYLLPSKAEFAYKLNVSVGTVQSAIRMLEYEGHVISKQRIGTIINNNSAATSSIKKSFTKKDKAYEEICKYIEKLRIGAVLPSTRILASELDFSQNTIRLALDALVNEKVIEIKKTNNSDFAWIVKKMPQQSIKAFEKLSITERISKELINFMSKNSKVGDRLPAHNILSKKFAVSIKTINDVIKSLAQKGFLETRRGRYGTIVINNNDSSENQKTETSIFAHASVAFEYNYQKVKNSIINYIAENYDEGTKLPTMQEFSEIFDVSTNTIRKALTELSDAGNIVFQRGRFGGTFLIKMPKIQTQTKYKWLAVSPEYQEVYNN